MDNIASYLASLTVNLDIETLAVTIGFGLGMTSMAIFLLAAVRPRKATDDETSDDEVSDVAPWPAAAHWFPAMVLIGWPSYSFAVITRWRSGMIDDSSVASFVFYGCLGIGILFIIVTVTALGAHVAQILRNRS